MPRGSELYTPMSQALLRAARRGQVTKRDGESTEHDKDPADEEEAEDEPDTVFQPTKWAQIPKDQEVAEIEFLAKRRKGLQSLLDEPGVAGAGVPMRKVKVRKVDAQGNASVFDVLAPEGLAVEGEIIGGDEEVLTEAPAPGTVVEGVGVANAEGVVVAGDQVMPAPRRMPPRPKRKMKGPGRGRKKKLMVAPGSEGPAGATGTGTAVPGGEGGDGGLKVPGAGADAASGSDVDMGNESAAREGEEGSDEEDDEGDDGDDGDVSEAGPSRSISKEPAIAPPAGTGESAPLTRPPAANPAPADPELAASADAPTPPANQLAERAPPIPAPLAIPTATAASELAVAAAPPAEPPIIASPVLVSPTVRMPGSASMPLPPEARLPVAEDSSGVSTPSAFATAMESAASPSGPFMADQAHADPGPPPVRAERAHFDPARAPPTDVASEAAPVPAEPAMPADAVDVAAPGPGLAAVPAGPGAASEHGPPAHVDAVLPPEHNPLDGLAQPKADAAAPGTVPAAEANEEQAMDGGQQPEERAAAEEAQGEQGGDAAVQDDQAAEARRTAKIDNLLGPLEAHLDQPGK